MLSRDELKAYCQQKPAAQAEQPFDPNTTVYKVGGKMFALISETETPPRLTLKCKPEQAPVLRAQYPEIVIPGYYMNKQHWNTVICEGTVPDEELRGMIDFSYDLVLGGLSKKARAALLG